MGTDEWKKKTNEHMASCDDISQWFGDKYKRSKDKNRIVYVSDIFDIFKTSFHFDNLSKSDNTAKQYFDEKVAKNMSLKKIYKRHSGQQQHLNYDTTLRY